MDVAVALNRLLGPDGVSAAQIGDRTDWYGRVGGIPLAVVRPAGADEAAALLRIASEHGLPVVPQGGSTGLVGGGIPAPDCPATTLLLNTTRMRGVTDIDRRSGQLTAAAGTTLAEVQLAAAGVGWRYGVDLAARDTATIGGTVATNAGGLRVCAYGDSRAQVIGVEAVLPDGSVVSDLRGLPKDNTGYHLPGLLCGSEGTLALITKVRLRLHRPPPAATTVAVPVADLATGAELVATALEPGVPLLAAEVVDAAGWRDYVREQASVAPIWDTDGWVVLIEAGDGGGGSGFTGQITGRTDAAVALDPRSRQMLWEVREGQSELWAARPGHLHKFDVSLPIGQLDPVVQQLRRELGAAGYRMGVFGHLHEGNLHIQVLGGAADDPQVAEHVLGLVGQCGGSISAEHGVGRDKARYLPLRRSESELAAMTAIKSALDPGWRMNPGVILPARNGRTFP